MHTASLTVMSYSVIPIRVYSIGRVCSTITESIQTFIRDKYTLWYITRYNTATSEQRVALISEKSDLLWDSNLSPDRLVPDAGQYGSPVNKLHKEQTV